MKGNFKKLTVFVMIIAIAMFTVVEMASADDHHWRKAIHGEYAFTGTGACLFGVGGFNDNFIPRVPGGGLPGPNFWDGVYKFNKDGTGSMDARHRFMNDTPGAGLAHLYWEFTYKIDRGKITFEEIPSSYVAEYVKGPQTGSLYGVAFSEPYDGYISADGKNLIVSFGVPMKLLFGAPCPADPINPQCLEIVCSGTFQGFRTDWDE